MKLLDYVMWWIFPQHCAGCGKLIGRQETLCKTCNEKIEKIDKICTKCGCSKEKCCCKNYIYRFAACVSPFYAGEISKSCVYSYKISRNSCIADFLAENIYESVEKYYSGIKFDAVTSVPMGIYKKYKTGYDHSEILAKKIAEKLNVPYKEMLYKRYAHTQHILNKKERLEKIDGVFASFGDNNYDNVLLIDDIKTTGASLNECTKILAFSGVRNVYCATALTSE